MGLPLVPALGDWFAGSRPTAEVSQDWRNVAGHRLEGGIPVAVFNGEKDSAVIFQVALSSLGELEVVRPHQGPHRVGHALPHRVAHRCQNGILGRTSYRLVENPV